MSFSEEIIDSASGGAGLALTPRTIAFLNEIRKWANFLSVLGFIGVGFLVLIALFAGTVMSSFSRMAGAGMGSGVMTSMIYILFSLIYFFPILYLYRFAAKLKLALSANDIPSLESAFENLKSHYKFIGVLAIIMMAFYAIMILFGLIAGLGSMAMFS